MLHCAICEDEPEMAAALAALLDKTLKAAGQPGCIHRFAGGRALLQSGREYDLVFLDIRLGDDPKEPPAAPEGTAVPAGAPGPDGGQAPASPDGPQGAAGPNGTVPAGPAPDSPAPLDGLQTARLLRARGSRCLLIFVTVLREQVFDAFAVEAFDYLTKPIDPARFARTMERALRALAGRGRQRLIVPQAGGCEVLPLEQLVYCEVQGRRLYLHRLDGPVLSMPGRMKELEGQLDGRFFKCHRSYLVNLDHLRGFAGGLASLPGDQTIPVSRLREQALADALLRRMKDREG